MQTPIIVREIQSLPDLERYVAFVKEVYQDDPYWVCPDEHEQLAMLSRQNPMSRHVSLQCFLAEREGRIVATATAIRDPRFDAHWQQQAGHIAYFEALPGEQRAAQQLLNAACDWLRESGAGFARLTFLFGWGLGIGIDTYRTQPTVFHPYNPSYYHSMIKNGGFVTERGVVEYVITFDEALAAHYRKLVAGATGSGIELRTWDFDQIERENELFTALYNETFASHWGAPPFTAEQFATLTVDLRHLLKRDYCIFAHAGEEVAGGVLALPDLNRASRGQPVDHAALLTIGVRQPWRGRGINLMMAAKSYLAMMENGCKSASYTVVLDDNRPSRRTAEKLGGLVARNYNIYRRDF
ncbi:MAG: GNAT family N-acetyltransferase [Acidobacteria bacterium]|nr:GNAT family N-acetyltransferase [Acidobacteriota bacterium]